MPRLKYKHFGIISSWCNNSLTSNDIMSSYIGNMKNQARLSSFYCSCSSSSVCRRHGSGCIACLTFDPVLGYSFAENK